MPTFVDPQYHHQDLQQDIDAIDDDGIGNDRLKDPPSTVGGGAGTDAGDDNDDIDDDDDDEEQEQEQEQEEEGVEGVVHPHPPHPHPHPHPPSFLPPSSSAHLLLSSLRDSRAELEDAESADRLASARLAVARAAYDECARRLGGLSPCPPFSKRGASVVASSGVDRDVAAKKRARGTTTTTTAIATSRSAATAIATTAAPSSPAAAAAATPRDDDDEDDVMPPPPPSAPANELFVPDRRASIGIGASVHRDEFYLRLTNGEANSSTISSWRPPPNNANWKSSDQLDEWMDVVRHWDTGKDGLDAGAFRARHKTFYSRMKPASCNLGRRTGMHLREAMVEGEGREGGGKVATTVLCRYNKAGNKSIMYLAVDQLFDALFQLHSLELSHRGRDATKTLADERYANVPDATIRAFLDTCPICAARRGHHVSRNGPDVVADPSKRGGGHHDHNQSSILGLQDSI